MKAWHRIKSILRAPKYLIREWWAQQEVMYHNQGVFISFPSVFQFDDINALRIAPDVCIGAFSEIVALAKSPNSKIAGKLIIQERVFIGSHANIRAAGGEVLIGRDTKIGQRVSLIASNHIISPRQVFDNVSWDEAKTGIIIGENVWIGAGTIVLPGCIIGDNSVIGAGSVVTKRVPKNELWAGIPAKKIRDLSDSDERECLD
jgi:acetyltransferase-like isoleucine patch superfamily enzyme